MNKNEQIVIVGGGLVGSLLALSLKKEGLDPLVIEKRNDPRGAALGDEGRSINLVLSAKGLYALNQLNMADEVMTICSPVYGRMMHSMSGELTYQPYGRESDCNYSVSRDDLNKLLILKGLQEGVRYEFKAKVIDYKPSENTIIIEQKEESFQITAKHFFGTDGAGSKMRKKLVPFSHGTESVEFLDQKYKELLVPRKLAEKLDSKALHIWPRGHHMLMALINEDESFTLTLYLQQNGEKFGFGYLDTPQKIREYFQTYFNDVIDLVPNLEEDFLLNPVGKLGTVRTDSWCLEDKVLLIGDASHAIVPFFGQGMNSGFQDVTLLVDLWKQKKNWQQVFSEFYQLQKPNADAIADMALENFVEMSEKVGDEKFLLRKKIESVLNKKFPQQYQSRYSLVMYGQTPYSVCQKVGLVQQEILQELSKEIKNIEDLNLPLAKKLMEEKLKPVFKEYSVELNHA